MFANRVKETTQSLVSPFQLDGAVSGFRTFVAGIGNGKRGVYLISDGSTKWECGIGTVADASPDTITTVTVLDSSNGGSAETFSAGAKTIVCDLPASFVFRQVQSKAGPTYTTVANDFNTVIRATGTLALTLLAATTVGNGWYCAVRNSGTTTEVTITPASGTINGRTSIILPAGAECIVVSDGTNFYTLGLNRMEVAPRGDCYLQLNATNLELVREGGKYLFINGYNEVVPTSTTLSSGGTANNTLYYIYAFMNSGTFTLEASTTAPTRDSTHGHWIKTGDASRTLVGAARTQSGAASWEDSSSVIGVISFFNRRRKGAKNGLSAGATFTSSTYSETGLTGLRTRFITWDDEDVIATAMAGCLHSVANSTMYIAVTDSLASPNDGAQAFCSAKSSSGWDLLVATDIIVKTSAKAVADHITMVAATSAATMTVTGNAAGPTTAGIRASVKAVVMG